MALVRSLAAPAHFHLAVDAEHVEDGTLVAVVTFGTLLVKVLLAERLHPWKNLHPFSSRIVAAGARQREVETAFSPRRRSHENSTERKPFQAARDTPSLLESC